MDHQLGILTAGGLSIQRDGKPVERFVSRKADALLIYLAANPREHPREVLGQLLWDDLPLDRTLANLRMVLSSLRQQLEPFLVVNRYSVAINPDSAYRLDVLELDAALATGDQPSKASGIFPPALAERLENALKLYHGAFLEGFYVRHARGFEGWKLLEQERLHTRILETLYRLGSSALKQGQYAAGMTHISQLLQYDPLWEEAHRLQMLLLASAGNRTAALAQFETCQRLLKENLDVTPATETFELYRQISDGEIKTVFQERIPRNLPVPSTVFVGRTTELNEVAAQLTNPDCRLLTLIGPGGVGKTRLALEVAQRNLSNFPDGVYLVVLSAVNHPEPVIQAIAHTLQLEFSGSSEPLLELIDAVQDKRLLLLLDNFEDLVDQADMLSDMLARLGQIKILVTSTSRLNLREEWLYPVQGLSDGETGSAAQLFLQTAQRVKRDFAFDAQRDCVTQICGLVDGLPLGIELAASWVHILPCQQIAEQILEDPGFLSTSLRNLPERHRSLQVLFDQAVSRLDINSRAIFLRLSVFEGRFTREAAARVAGASLGMLAALVEKSLLRVTDSGHYDMHMLLKRFANARLEQNDALAAAENAHLNYYTELAENLAKREDDLPIGMAYADLVKALNTAVTSQQSDHLMRLVNALAFYWRRRGYRAEGRQWFQQALAAETTDATLRARTVSNAEVLAQNPSDIT